MTTDYPTDEVPATPEYVFDLCRQLVALYSPTGPPAFTFAEAADSPADTFFGHDVWLVGLTLEETFGLDIPDEELRQIEPLSRKTIGEVCEFIAARITRPVIRPWRHAAGDCLPAGAFLTVRAMLAESGANPNEITPATPLGAYLRRYRWPFLTRLGRLAPGRVPPVRERFPLWGFLSLIFAAVPLGVLLLLDELGIQPPAWAVYAAAFGGFPFTLLGIGLMIREVRRPRLGNLVTFRDLAYALAGQQPRRRIQPTS